MGTDVAEVVETLPPPRAIKVHRLMCTELMALVDRVVKIFPDIEAARPRCSSGLEALCLLNSAIEKATLLIQYCSESSKLYLALTGDKILSRCKRSKSLLEHSLSQIQNMVPVMLAAEIFQIIADLKRVTFILDPSEEEARNAVKTLLQQHNYAVNSVQESAMEGIRVVTSKLHLTSQKALLIERRSIRKLLDKVGDSDQSKKQILLFLLGLLNKYGKSIAREQEENDNNMQNQDSYLFANQSPQRDLHIEYEHVDAQTDYLRKPILPEEFKCPISFKLMYDPVVISSGQTFERFWIQKWFDEGHDTCPKTKRKLVHKSLTPNTAMKDLITKWCIAHGITLPDPSIQLTEMNFWENSSTSINSLSISMNNLHLPVDFSSVSLGSLDNSQNSVSSHVKATEDSHRFQSHAELDAPSLHKLDSLPWDSQCKAVEDVMIHMKRDDIVMSSENIVEPLLRFLKDAHDLHDVKAQRIGCLLLLIFFSKCSRRVPYLYEGAHSLLASFLDSEVIEEALALMEVLSCHECYRSEIAASGALASILKILETQIIEFRTPAMKIIYNLTLNTDILSLIVSSELIPKLVPFFEDVALARYCIAILKNLCDNKDARVSIAETKGCISFIANILENNSCEEQEEAVAILLSLCSQSVQYCRLVMSEGIIPAVVLFSVNGNDKGKSQALELLRVLRDVDYDDMQETPGLDFGISKDLNKYSKEKKSSSKAPRIFSKLSIFSRSSLAPKRKL